MLYSPPDLVPDLVQEGPLPQHLQLILDGRGAGQHLWKYEGGKVEMLPFVRKHSLLSIN